MITLIADGIFPLDNIAFRLFLETIRWYSLKTTTNMWYWEDTLKFWKMGYRLLKDKFILFMGGLKSTGQIVAKETTRGLFDPVESSINFAVPSPSTLRAFGSDQFPRILQPGIIKQGLEVHKDSDTDYIVSMDGKKLVPGIDDNGGEIDLFGYEPHSTAAADKGKCEVELEHIVNSISLLKGQTDTVSDIHRQMEKAVIALSLRLKDIKTVKLKQEITMERLMEKSKNSNVTYQYAMSSIRSTIHQIDETTDKSLNVIGNVARTCSILNGSKDFETDCSVSRSSQQNWVGLHSTDMLPGAFKNDPHYIQQRSAQWQEFRSTFKVTGSTMHNALGFRSVKEQKIHFDKVIHGKEVVFTEDVLKRMEHGTENEPNAIATLTGVILPFIYPKLIYVEVGSYPVAK